MLYVKLEKLSKFLYSENSEAKKVYGYLIVKPNGEKHFSEIVDFIKNYDWNGYIQGIAMKRLKQFHIIEVLKENFSNLR